MPTPLDPRDLLEPPPLDVPSAIALGNALAEARPKGAPGPVKRAAKHLRKAVKHLEAAYQATTPETTPTEDPRPIDRRVDIVWGSLYRRLDSLAALPAATCPRAAEAAALRDRLFPPGEGLSFLALAFTAEWAAVKARLERIDEDALAPAVDALAGPEYLPEIRASFEAYTRALNLAGPAEDQAVAESRMALLKDVGEAIRDYCIAVLGMRGKSEKKSAAVRAALEPVLEHRARLRARESESDEVQ